METKKEIERNEVVSVNYTQPKFWHRCMANLVDFFLMVAMFLILFIAARAVVGVTPDFKKAENRIAEIQLESGLYLEDQLNEGKYVDIVYYLDKYEGTYGSDFEVKDNPVGKIGKIVYVIDKFEKFCSNNSPKERYDELVSYYDSIRLDTLTKDGVHYFVRNDENKIVPNEALASNAEKRKDFYKDVYAKFVEKTCLPFLTSNVPEYRELYRVEFTDNYLH